MTSHIDNSKIKWDVIHISTCCWSGLFFGLYSGSWANLLYNNQSNSTLLFHSTPFHVKRLDYAWVIDLFGLSIYFSRCYVVFDNSLSLAAKQWLRFHRILQGYFIDIDLYNVQIKPLSLKIQRLTDSLIWLQLSWPEFEPIQYLFGLIRAWFS